MALGLNPPPLEKPAIFTKSRAKYRPLDFAAHERPVIVTKEYQGVSIKMFRCEPCNMDAENIEVYKQHIIGRKHKLVGGIYKDVC